MKKRLFVLISLLFLVLPSVVSAKIAHCQYKLPGELNVVLKIDTGTSQALAYVYQLGTRTLGGDGIKFFLSQPKVANYFEPASKIDAYYAKNGKLCSNFIYVKHNGSYSTLILVSDDSAVFPEDEKNVYIAPLFKSTDSTNPVGDLQEPEFQTCEEESIFGNPKQGGKNKSPAFLISFAFSVIRYIAIILLVVMTAMDFLHAVTASDDGELNKVFKKTITRFIFCILIFFLPSLLELLFSLVYNGKVGDCIEKVLELGGVS